jgi:hypothetical protein
MPKIVPIVEGQGEVEALPKLLYKLLSEMERTDILVGRPKNAHGCGNLLKQNGLERFLALALNEPDCDAVLILIDADKECPRTFAEMLARGTKALQPQHSVVIVVAKCEYEAWFLASLETIAGKPIESRSGLPAGLTFNKDVESIVGAKAWLTNKMPEGRIYKENEDQAPLTSLLDTALVRAKSRSFRRMCHAVEEAVASIDSKVVVVTPG